MRIRTMVGLAVAGVAATAAVVGGVTVAVADEEPIVRIVMEDPVAENAVQPDAEQPQGREDCPEKGGATEAPTSSEAGL